jgi:hypothetical protein
MVWPPFRWFGAATAERGPKRAMLRQVRRIPRAAGVLGWALGAAALHAAVPFQLSRLGGRARRPARPAAAARSAGLVTVAAGAALVAWAFAAHSAAAPQGWELESGPRRGTCCGRAPTG